MSKRKKRKFKSSYSPVAQPTANPVSHSVHHASSPDRPSVTDRPKADNPTLAAYSAHAREYKQIQTDLIKVSIVNGVLFALVLGLYFLNQSNGFLDNLFNSFF